MATGTVAVHRALHRSAATPAPAPLRGRCATAVATAAGVRRVLASSVSERRQGKPAQQQTRDRAPTGEGGRAIDHARARPAAAAEDWVRQSAGGPGSGSRGADA